MFNAVFIVHELHSAATLECGKVAVISRASLMLHMTRVTHAAMACCHGLLPAVVHQIAASHSQALDVAIFLFIS